MLPYRGGERKGSGRGPCSQRAGLPPAPRRDLPTPPPTHANRGRAPESRPHLPAQWDRPPGSKVDCGANPKAYHIPTPSGSRLHAFAVDAVAKSAAAAKPAAKPAAKGKTRSEVRGRCKVHSDAFCRCGARGEYCRRCEASGEACREGGCFKVRGEAYCRCEAADSRPVAKLAAVESP